MKSFKNSFILIALCAVMLGVTSCKNEAQKYLEKSAKEYNEQCPVMLSEYMRMDSCLVEPNLTLKFVGTLLSINAGDAEFQPEILSADAKKNILRTLQNTPSFEIFKKYSVTLQYVYRDANGNLLYEVLITPEDYDAVLNGSQAEDEINVIIGTTRLEVQGMQKELPIDMGNGFEMTNVQFLEAEKMLKYTIVVENAEIKQDVKVAEKTTREVLIENLTKTKETSTALRHDFVFRYLYTDAKGKTLFTIDVTKDDL